MTVCVAAFAAKSKAIVLVSDKALTYDRLGEAPMQADTGVHKILAIGKSGWQALVAGDPSVAETIIHRAALELVDPGDSGSAMHCVKEAYQVVREEMALDKVLRPRLLTKDLLVARRNSLGPLPDDYLVSIAEQVARFDVGCSLLVCGFDSRGRPHLFSVAEPGTATSHDMTGFHAIGIGDSAATARLLWEEADRTDELAEALYDTFHAKVQAEVIQGVGYEWDAWILVKDKGLMKVPLKVRRAIEDIFVEATRSPFDRSRRPSKARMSRWHRILKEFATRALAKKASLRAAAGQ